MKYQAILFLALAYSTHNEAYACSCVDPRSLNGLVEHDYAFVGQVQVKNTGTHLYQNLFTFLIDQNVSGDLPPKIDLWSDKSSAACGYRYEENQRYLVIAYNNDGKYYSGLCSSWPLESQTAQRLLSTAKKISD